MTIVYQLSRNEDFIRQVQKATQTTKEFGIEPTHGLYGSTEWWANIQSGKLRLHTLRGEISRTYMGSMGDWPEFTLKEANGTETHWTREANSPEQFQLYQAGCVVELDYVIQWHRPASWDKGGETKCVIEVRVEAQPSVPPNVPASAAAPLRPGRG